MVCQNFEALGGVSIIYDESKCEILKFQLMCFLPLGGVRVEAESFISPAGIQSHLKRSKFLKIPEKNHLHALSGVPGAATHF